MKLLLKLGGTLLDAADSRDGLARQVAGARSAGHEIAVVHGGGKQMTRYLADRGIHSTFVGGLRVTTPETVDAVLKVFAGSVNHELVAWSRPSRWTPRSAPSAVSPNPTPPCCTC